MEPIEDLHSHQISSKKMHLQLGFVPPHSIQDAVQALVTAYHADNLSDSLDDPRYVNIMTMQNVNLV